MNKEQLKFINKRFKQQFTDATSSEFKIALNQYNSIDNFSANGNIFDVNDISDHVHFIMRTNTQYHLTNAFKAMKIDLEDPNIAEDLTVGNIGTPGRIAKVFCGANIDDDRELGSGRWSKKPRVATFPNTSSSKIPITKRVDLVSNCSHHFISFNSMQREDSYVVISYIPNDFILGISKLQRLVDWISQRFFLQEDLTTSIYKEISQIVKTDSVYIGLFNIVHGCESLRGVKSKEGSFTTEYYGGDFNNAKLREEVKK